MKSLKSFADSKRLKYGTINIIFISLVIAIVIVANSVISLLSDLKGWYLDMTKEQLYTVSDPLLELIETVSTDTELDIIFCCDKDQAKSHYSDLAKGNVLAYVHSTATQLADKLDNINVVYKDPIKDYTFIKQFSTLSNQPKPSESTIIVARKDANGEYTKQYRTYHTASFYTFAEEVDGSKTIYGYNGERVFATAILSLTMDKIPTVYFVTGHDEDVLKKSGDTYEKHQAITTFEDCGYNVRYISLMDKQLSCKTSSCDNSWGLLEFEDAFESSKSVVFTCDSCNREYNVTAQDFNEARTIPKNARAIVINNPKRDYIYDETLLLSNYLILNKGTVMCFVDPEKSKDFSELTRFIHDEAGVTIVDNSIVSDSVSSSSSSVEDFRGVVSSSDAASVYLGSLQNFSASRPIFSNSGILEIDPKYSNSETGGFNNNLATRYTLPIIETSPSATFNGQGGKYNVMSVTSFTSTRNNESVYSYLVVSPSAGFLSDEYLSQTKYINREIMYSLIYSTTAVNAPVNLDFKTFEDYSLDISAKQQRSLFICTITILPVLAIGTGVFVIVRRKHR